MHKLAVAAATAIVVVVAAFDSRQCKLGLRCPRASYGSRMPHATCYTRLMPPVSPLLPHATRHLRRLVSALLRAPNGHKMLTMTLNVAHTHTHYLTRTWSSRARRREWEREHDVASSCACGSNDARVIWQHPVNRISSTASPTRWQCQRRSHRWGEGATLQQATAACVQLKSMQWKVRNLSLCVWAKCVAADDGSVSATWAAWVARTRDEKRKKYIWY